MRIKSSIVLALIVVVSGYSELSFSRYLQADPIGVMRDYSLLNGVNGYSPQLQDPRIRLNHPYGYSEQNPVNYIDPNGLDSIRTALMQAIARGDTRQIKTLMDLLTDPKLQRAAQEALKKFGSKADDWIQKQCKGSVREEFPSEYLDKTLEQIRRDKSKLGKKAWKLLNDSRFRK